MTIAGLRPEPVLSVLVVEDLEWKYRNVQEALAMLDCEVAIRWARNYDEARELLIGEYFQLIVLDLVLDPQTERNPDAWEGFWLVWDVLQFEIGSSRAVVIYTDYKDHEVERRALKRYEVADFIVRTDTKTLGAELRALYEERNGFGLACQIEFDDGLSWEELVRLCTRRQSQSLAARMSQDLARAELEALFRLEFSKCRRIRIKPMALGYSGTALVRVEREFADGSRAADVVAKFGDVGLIQQEIDGWTALADYLETTRATEILASRRGIGLGILQYRFLGAGNAKVVPFPTFYAEASVGEIDHALRALFHETCGLWYREAANRQPAEGLRLDETYKKALGVDIARLVTSYEFRFGVPCRDNDVVDYPELNRELPHLVSAIKDDHLRFRTDTWLCRTHGDLHGDNVLVAKDDGNCWLIDFGRSGVGHWARDLAVLEAFVHFKLVTDGDLGELLTFETVLASPSGLDEDLDLSALQGPSTRKAAAAIQGLRQAAAELIDPYPPERAMAEYLVALTFATSKYIEFHGLLDKRWRKHHVLLAGGAMIERLRQYFVPAELIGTDPPDR